LRLYYAAIAALSLLVAPSAEAAIRGPNGIEAQTVARGLGHPTAVAFDSAGRMWTTSAQYGVSSSDGVWFVKRRGARPRHVVRRLNTALGLTWFRGELFVSHVVPYRASGGRYTGRVTAFSRFNGRRFERRRTVVKGIPTGLHRVNNIVPGPGGRLYMGVGSAGDAYAGSRYGGTVVSFRPGGGGLRIEARGLRNPYGLDFAPDGKTLYVSDNGRDDLGNNRPPEELNRFDVTGSAPHFGFPRCWGSGGGRCGGTRPPFAELAPHSAVGGVAVVNDFGRFGPSVFVAEHGSTIASPPTGSVVRRVPLKSGGSDDLRFATGFRRYEPLGLAVGPGGALYVTLHSSGRLIRFVP
jgi:glucose/arabinose dehydrogenase